MRLVVNMLRKVTLYIAEPVQPSNGLAFLYDDDGVSFERFLNFLKPDDDLNDDERLNRLDPDDDGLKEDDPLYLNAEANVSAILKSVIAVKSLVKNMLSFSNLESNEGNLENTEWKASDE